MKFFPFIFILLFSCKQQQPSPILTKKIAKPAPAPVLPINYDSCKKRVTLVKQQYRPQWSRLAYPEKEKIFSSLISGTILPAWTGTPWSFYGTSEKPGEGSIACGYFVTTVLRDAGLPLARSRLAQCASEQMITGLISKKWITRFSNVPMETFMAGIEKSGYGIYLVGLDNHTGFIYHDGKDIWFIHSTFVGTRNVQKEPAAGSWVLRQSHYKVLGKLSADEAVLNRWIENRN